MNSDQVTISIITASFNAATSIEANIKSVLSQSYNAFEHIIIDGGSTDETLEIVKSYANKYPLQWISEPDHGIADAMNKGLKHATGQYLLALHADDRLYDRHSIQNAVSHLQSKEYDIYTSPVLLEYADRKRILRKPYPFLWWYHFKTPFCHQGTLVHQRVFNRIGRYNEEYAIAMDYDFFYRALKLKPRILYHKRPLSIMGAYGVGTRKDSARTRLEEEYRVQTQNEKNPFWRISQHFFKLAYHPYKSFAVKQNRQ